MCTKSFLCLVLEIFFFFKPLVLIRLLWLLRIFRNEENYKNPVPYTKDINARPMEEQTIEVGSKPYNNILWTFVCGDSDMNIITRVLFQHYSENFTLFSEVHLLAISYGASIMGCREESQPH